MKRISQKDIKNGFKWCDYCIVQGVKTEAIYKSHGKKCCEFHKPSLDAFITDDNMTEADNQTWGRHVI